MNYHHSFTHFARCASRSYNYRGLRSLVVTLRVNINQGLEISQQSFSLNNSSVNDTNEKHSLSEDNSMSFSLGKISTFVYSSHFTTQSYILFFFSLLSIDRVKCYVILMSNGRQLISPARPFSASPSTMMKT